ncbi:MAG: M1 family aminopeptidase [Actinomycetes bacterium]
MADDLRSATGSSTTTFTPDQRVCEVVLRAWPNKPVLTDARNGMTIDRVSVNGTALQVNVQAAGASPGAFGTLVEAKLPECQEAGTTLSVETDFALALGPDTDERMGYSTSGDVAWFQTAFPLLAWQAGVGWVRDAAVAMHGETVTSETFELADLAVSAPTRFNVSGVGKRGTTTSDGPRTTHHFSAPHMRDVSVMVGSFTPLEYSTSGTTVHLSVPESASLNDEDAWRSVVDASLSRLVDYLGPVPFTDLWVNVVPGASEGIEASGSVQFGGRGRRIQGWLVTHELGHQWTYALVGNNQALHPWLDESVTSMIQAVADDPDRSPEPANDSLGPEADDIGQPMSFFAASRRPDEAYDEAVYTAGSDVLVRARDAAGHGAFDAALRNYLERNAHRVASPQDFRMAFEGVPGVVETLGRHGMVP